MIGPEKIVSGLPGDLVIPLPGNGFLEPTGGGAKFSIVAGTAENLRKLNPVIGCQG